MLGFEVQFSIEKFCSVEKCLSFEEPDSFKFIPFHSQHWKTLATSFTHPKRLPLEVKSVIAIGAGNHVFSRVTNKLWGLSRDVIGSHVRH